MGFARYGVADTNYQSCLRRHPRILALRGEGRPRHYEAAAREKGFEYLCRRADFQNYTDFRRVYCRNADTRLDWATLLFRQRHTAQLCRCADDDIPRHGAYDRSTRLQLPHTPVHIPEGARRKQARHRNDFAGYGHHDTHCGDTARCTAVRARSARNMALGDCICSFSHAAHLCRDTQTYKSVCAVKLLIPLTYAHLAVVYRSSADAELGADFGLPHTVHVAV